MGYCFLQTIGGRCTARTSDLKTVTKADCCCTMGAAWGPHCEICPTKDSDNYNELCLDKGFSVNGQGTCEHFFLFLIMIIITDSSSKFLFQTSTNAEPSLTCAKTDCASILWALTDASAIKGTRQIRLELNASASIRRVLFIVRKILYQMRYIYLYRISDINECELTPRPCKYNCQNTEGSFICSCPAGFILNPDGVSCRDLDECATGNHLCQQNCINTQGSYTCGCQEGYTQDGDACHGLSNKIFDIIQFLRLFESYINRLQT